MKFVAIIATIVMLLSVANINAQDNDPVLSDVKLFQTFLRDAHISRTPFAEGGLSYSDFNGGSSFALGAQGGFPINPKVELGANLRFISISPEVGDGESGISDLALTGRYVVSQQKTNISAGGYITLPIGSDKIGQGNFDIGGFAAARHPLQNGMVLTGVLGLDLLETTEIEVEFDPTTGNIETKEKSKRDASILLGGGVIYPSSDNLNIIGEFNLQTEINYIMISGGVDYALKMGSKIRGFLGIGLDDGAPDFMLMGSFLHYFK